MSLNSPSLILESSWFKLAAWTWTSTSSSRTSGSGISPRRTALLLLYRSTTNAFMALGHAMGSLSGARLHVAVQARILQPSVPFAPVVDIGNRAVECCGRHVSRHYVLGFPHITTPRGMSGERARTSAPALLPNGSFKRLLGRALGGFVSCSQVAHGTTTCPFYWMDPAR